MASPGESVTGPPKARMPCLPCSVETATQTLHRLTSYQPGRDWDEAIDDPRIVQDLEANHGLGRPASPHYPALHVHAAVCIYLQSCPRCSAPCPSANASASPSPAVSTPR